MKSLNKTKMVLQASIVLVIALAFVMPVTAATANMSLTNIASFEPKNLFKDPEWVEQASGFWEPSRGIDYISAVDENIAWATCYDGSGSSLPVQEFTRTINGGELWEADSIDGAPAESKTAMIFALDAMTAWVPLHSGDPQGIWKTSDGGVTWVQQTTADFTGGFPNTVHFWNQNEGWCMGDPVDGYYEIYTTTNGGENWVRVPSENIPAPESSTEYGVTGYYDVVGDTIWFGTQDSTNPGRVFKSTDRGLHWTVSFDTLFEPGAYVDVRFKDESNGLAMNKIASATAQLTETNDGGNTWWPIEFSGTCYDYDFDYVPGTNNMYVSTGVNSADESQQGAAYSLDGGHSWTIWEEMAGIQLIGTDWVEGKIGWAGAFNVDDTTGGVWKHIGNTAPALTFSIAGGKGFVVTVKNVGESAATNVDCNIVITGGLFVSPKEFSGSQALLEVGQEFTITGKPIGFGLGILKAMPSIKIDATCDEGVSATRTIKAKIFLSTITLQ